MIRFARVQPWRLSVAVQSNGRGRFVVFWGTAGPRPPGPSQHARGKSGTGSAHNKLLLIGGRGSRRAGSAIPVSARREPRSPHDVQRLTTFCSEIGQGQALGFGVEGGKPTCEILARLRASCDWSATGWRRRPAIPNSPWRISSNGPQTPRPTPSDRSDRAGAGGQPIVRDWFVARTSMHRRQPIRCGRQIFLYGACSIADYFEKYAPNRDLACCRCRSVLCRRLRDD